jgi:hypothetical protein
MKIKVDSGSVCFQNLSNHDTKKSDQKYADLGKGQWWWWLLEGLRIEAIDMDRSSVPIRIWAVWKLKLKGVSSERYRNDHQTETP